MLICGLFSQHCSLQKRLPFDFQTLGVLCHLEELWHAVSGFLSNVNTLESRYLEPCSVKFVPQPVISKTHATRGILDQKVFTLTPFWNLESYYFGLMVQWDSTFVSCLEVRHEMEKPRSKRGEILVLFAMHEFGFCLVQISRRHWLRPHYRVKRNCEMFSMWIQWRWWEELTFGCLLPSLSSFSSWSRLSRLPFARLRFSIRCEESQPRS